MNEIAFLIPTLSIALDRNDGRQMREMNVIPSC